ncbi:hypothetical protein MCOR25_010947 [Pyricularia grisea]|nr:hypothetical protein MCOR25_010947 [Pyricularia grisea]
MLPFPETRRRSSCRERDELFDSGLLGRGIVEARQGQNLAAVGAREQAGGADLSRVLLVV